MTATCILLVYVFNYNGVYSSWQWVCIKSVCNYNVYAFVIVSRPVVKSVFWWTMYPMGHCLSIFCRNLILMKFKESKIFSSRDLFYNLRHADHSNLHPSPPKRSQDQAIWNFGSGYWGDCHFIPAGRILYSVGVILLTRKLFARSYQQWCAKKFCVLIM